MPRRTIAQLEALLVETDDLLKASKQAHADDVKKISEALGKEAEDRDWCDDYQQFVADLNPSLEVPLAAMERDLEVTVYGTVRVPFAYTVTLSTDLAANDNNEALRQMAIAQVREEASLMTLAQNHEEVVYLDASRFPDGKDAVITEGFTIET
jgi:hypothetical protein